MAIQQRLKKVVSFRTTSLIIMRMIEIGLKIWHISRVQSKKWLRLKYLDQIFPVLYFIIFPDNTEQLKMYLFIRLLFHKSWFQKNWRKNFSWKELNFYSVWYNSFASSCLRGRNFTWHIFFGSRQSCIPWLFIFANSKKRHNWSHWKVFSSEIGSSNQFLLHSYR